MRRRFKILAGAAMLVALVAGAFGAAQAFAYGYPAQAVQAPASAYRVGVYGNGWMASGGMGYSMVEAASQVLDVSVQDIYQGLRDGKTLAAQAEAKGMAPSAIVDAFKAAEQARLAQLVQNGTLTQQQADYILQWHVGRANWMMNNSFGGYGPYGLGMMGGWYGSYGQGMMGGWYGNANGSPYGPGMMGWNGGRWGTGFGPGMMGGWNNSQGDVPYGSGMMSGQFGVTPAVPLANQVGPAAGAGMMNGGQGTSPAAPAPNQATNQYGPGMMANGLRQSSPQTVFQQSAPAVNQPAAPAVNQAQTRVQTTSAGSSQNGGALRGNQQRTQSSVGTGMMGSGAIGQGGAGRGMGMMGR